MVYFAVNHHTFDILSLELRRSQEDTAFTLEDLIRLSLGLKRLGVSQIEYGMLKYYIVLVCVIGAPLRRNRI